MSSSLALQSTFDPQSPPDAGAYDTQYAAKSAVRYDAGTAAPADSATSSSDTITASDFLTLLVTELKNQDPTSDQDPNAYITQLVGVNSLQQLIAINQDLTPAATTSSTPSSTASASPSSAVTAKSAQASEAKRSSQPGEDVLTTAILGASSGPRPGSDFSGMPTERMHDPAATKGAFS